MPDESKPPVMRPCPMAFAAMSVPARRWDTRTDLIIQLSRAETYLSAVPAEEFSLRSAAEVAGLSLHHFLRLFHEVYGLTPRQFIARRQVQQAQILLETTDLSVYEIAVEVGFGNASAFSRFFRLQTGSSPSEFRQRRV